jgi:hypothetical protein
MPLEQLLNAVNFYAFYTLNGARAVGLTVTIDVYEVTEGGVSVQVVNNGACTEIGDGFYFYRLTGPNVDATGEYLAVFTTAGASDTADMASSWTIGRAGIENLDTLLSTIAAAVWAVTAEGGHTYADIQRICLAVLAGRSTGGGGPILSFRDLANAKDRVRVQVDTNGNRVLIITLDGT